MYVLVLGGINILLPVYGITNSKQIQNGIRYFTVFWSSTDTQIKPYNWHFCYIKN